MALFKRSFQWHRLHLLALISLIALGFVGGVLYLTLSSITTDSARQLTPDSGAKTLPDPRVDLPPSATSGEQTLVLAGGCFWGVEAVFEHVKGVSNVVSGFAGGSAATANYTAVSFGQTGHAESVKITYDPTQISYGQLLKIYFTVAHDPTQLNRQGPDAGSQYRSAIFFANPDQQRVAQAYIDQLNQAGSFGQPIVTQLTPSTDFYAAEDYHQDFITRNPTYPYVVVHDLPKLRQLQQQFGSVYKNPVSKSPVSQN
jgi:peptide-methionine (S)-S-oxide reductase